MKKVFIGIDFSKTSFDVAVLKSTQSQEIYYNKFNNHEDGCLELIQWIKSLTKQHFSSWLFCGEFTGIYSITLIRYLNENNIDIWMEPGTQIKYSKGITRGKNDKIDAKNIALYAYRFQDKAKSFRLPLNIIEGIKDLMAYRERLIKIKKMLTISANELKRVKKEDMVSEYIFQESVKQILDCKEKIKQVELKLMLFIQQDALIKENFNFITSVKGVGMINAIMIIISTNNFTSITNPRKFACYSGVVPFEHRSGSSIRGKTRLSNIANKKLKSLLSQAAMNAIRFDPLIKNYYNRKLLEGKTHRLVLNNVRNKLVHRIFAVVKNKTYYTDMYNNQFAIH